MKKRTLITFSLFYTLLVGCSSDKPDLVSFKQDVYPLLQKHCVSCHLPPEGEGFKKSGLSMESHRKLMEGTQHGAVIIPGKSINSSLNRMVEGRVDPSIKMPHGDKQLTDEEIVLLKNWVDQGAKNN